jgi:hypothetical protein
MNSNASGNNNPNGDNDYGGTQLRFDWQCFLIATQRIRICFDEYVTWLPFQRFDRDTDARLSRISLIQALVDYEVGRLNGLILFL